MTEILLQISVQLFKTKVHIQGFVCIIYFLIDSVDKQTQYKAWYLLSLKNIQMHSRSIDTQSSVEGQHFETESSPLHLKNKQKKILNIITLHKKNTFMPRQHQSAIAGVTETHQQTFFILGTSCDRWQMNISQHET